MDVKTEQKQDVLLTEDGDSGKMKVVAGLDENGKLKSVPPKHANEADFMKIDKQSNALENFLSNYFRQASNPKHTGFFRVTKDSIEEVASVISGLLKSGEEGKEFLSEYKVDTSKYQQQSEVQDQSSAHQQDQPQKQSQEQSQANQQEQQQTKSSYQPLDAEKIDWAMFEKIGITRESLEKSGALKDMLNYRRSPNLHPITMRVDDLTLNTDARLSLRRVDDGRLIPVIHAVRKEPQLDRPFYGNTFTPEDKENLLTNGNLGRTVDLNIKGLDHKITSFVGVDPKTNELVAYSTKNVRIPNEIKGVTLDETQRSALMEGKGVYLEGMTAKSGKSFNATVQVSASERGIVFKFDNAVRQQQTNNQSQDGVRIPSKLGGVTLSEENKAGLKNGDVIHVEGMLDKKGEKYNAYVKVNNEKGKLDFYKWDPRKKQGVTADNNSKTQVAVNSEGKTNEASKNLKEPMQRGQNEPTSQQQNKPRGMKM